MNQSILFPDIQEWDETHSVIIFPTQASGALIECTISKEKLEALSGKSICSANEAIEQFKHVRFDIEEMAEELIEDEEFGPEGRIEIA